MKEINKIKLMEISTILAQISSGNRTISGQKGIAMVHVKAMNELGKGIRDIIYDELKEKENTDA